MCAFVTGVQTCALPIEFCPWFSPRQAAGAARGPRPGRRFQAGCAPVAGPPHFSSGTSVDLLQYLVDKNNIFIVAVALVSGAMLAVPALRKGRSGSGIKIGRASCRERVCRYV